MITMSYGYSNSLKILLMSPRISHILNLASSGHNPGMPFPSLHYIQAIGMSTTFSLSDSSLGGPFRIEQCERAGAMRNVSMARVAFHIIDFRVF